MIPWFRLKHLSANDWQANWDENNVDFKGDAQYWPERDYWEVRIRAFPYDYPQIVGVGVATEKSRDDATQEAMRQAISKAKILQEDAGNPYSPSGIRRYE